MLNKIKENNDKHLLIGLNKNNDKHQWQDLEGNFCDQTVIDWYPGKPKSYHNNGENCLHVIATTSQLNVIPCDVLYSSPCKHNNSHYFYGLCEKILI